MLAMRQHAHSKSDALMRSPLGASMRRCRATPRRRRRRLSVKFEDGSRKRLSMQVVVPLIDPRSMRAAAAATDSAHRGTRGSPAIGSAANCLQSRRAPGRAGSKGDRSTSDLRHRHPRISQQFRIDALPAFDQATRKAQVTRGIRPHCRSDLVAVEIEQHEAVGLEVTTHHHAM